jgi:hypothetical protein
MNEWVECYNGNNVWFSVLAGGVLAFPALKGRRRVHPVGGLGGFVDDGIGERSAKDS